VVNAGVVQAIARRGYSQAASEAGVAAKK